MSDYQNILSTEHLYKSFGSLEVLKDVNLSVKKGEVICIIGPSGAGKSTYLRSLNQLEKITSGKIFIKDELFLHREHNRTIHRAEPEAQKAMLLEMGMVFQRFNLFPHKTVLENVMIAQVLVRKKTPEAAKKLAVEIIERVGLSDKLDVYPSKLSGGQQQRVAIARALATDPAILLADEPTGNLDSKTGDDIMALFHELHRAGDTIVLITHNEEIAKQAQRRIRIMDGRVSEVGA